MKPLIASSVVLSIALLATGCHSSPGGASASGAGGDVSESVHGALDGQKYDIEFFGMDGASQGPSRLTFAGGTFDSSFCRAHGFAVTSYSSSRKMDGIHFEATARSATNGTNEWKGTVLGGRIEGTVVSTDLKGVVDRCKFKGRKAP